MDEAPTTTEKDFPGRARARRADKAVVAEYIHELSERHRPRSGSARREHDELDSDRE